MVDLTVVNAKIFTRGSLFEGGIAVKGGKIVKIGKEPSLPRPGERIDAGGNVILPGLVDLHVHFREPGYTHKEDFLTGTRAASAGGVTTVVDEPNNRPVIDSLEALKGKSRLITPKAYVDYTFSVSLKESNLHLIREFRRRGVHCFTVFEELGGEPTGMSDTGVLLGALREVKEVGGLCMLNCRESDLVDHTVDQLRRAGRDTLEDYNSSFPDVAEAVGAAKRILLSSDTRVKAHLREVSTRATVDVLRNLRAVNVTREVHPDHLFLTRKETAEMGGYAQQWTPIRTGTDVDALWGALNEGVIEVVASDHATHTREEKEEGWADIWRSPPGLPAIETMLPLLLTEVNNGRLPLERLVEITSANPAQVLGAYPRKGVIEVGSDADLVIVDLNREHVITEEDSFAKNRWTPYEGRVVKGVPVATFVRGVRTFDEGVIVGEPGQGRFLGL